MYDNAHSKLKKYVAINISLSHRTPKYQATTTLERNAISHSSDSNPSNTAARACSASASSRAILTVHDAGVWTTHAC
jgi:hypothetical protein